MRGKDSVDGTFLNHAGAPLVLLLIVTKTNVLDWALLARVTCGSEGSLRIQMGYISILTGR